MDATYSKRLLCYRVRRRSVIIYSLLDYIYIVWYHIYMTNYTETLSQMLNQYIDLTIQESTLPLKDEINRLSADLSQSVSESTRLREELAAALREVDRLSLALEECQSSVPPAKPLAIIGGATGSNALPTRIESLAGVKFGVRRTYWNLDNISAAMSACRQDHEAGRVPYISFKLQTSWTNAADGAVDSRIKGLRDQLASLDKEVWVALHHEPEGDEPDIQEWVRMQRHLGPILKEAGDHVKLHIVLTGYHQREGMREDWSLDALWPGAPFEAVGLDAYQLYASQGGKVQSWTDLNTHLKFYGDWAKRNGAAWGLAETGISDDAYTSRFSEQAAIWIPDTIKTIEEQGGSFFCWFDTELNSSTTWRIAPGSEKERQFVQALQRYRAGA